MKLSSRQGQHIGHRTYVAQEVEMLSFGREKKYLG